jgi:stringent starvation protein B
MNELDLRIDLIKSYYKYILAIGALPYVTVNAFINGIDAPADCIDDNGIIIFNIAPSSIKYLNINNNLKFIAKFDGKKFAVVVPLGSITTIYSIDWESGYMEFIEKFSPIQHQHILRPALKGKSHLSLVN